MKEEGKKEQPLELFELSKKIEQQKLGLKQ